MNKSHCCPSKDVKIGKQINYFQKRCSNQRIDINLEMKLKVRIFCYCIFNQFTGIGVMKICTLRMSWSWHCIWPLKRHFVIVSLYRETLSMITELCWWEYAQVFARQMPLIGFPRAIRWQKDRPSRCCLAVQWHNKCWQVSQ